MNYSLFCTEVPTPRGKMPDLGHVVPVKSESMGAAIEAACKLMNGGAIVWQIKGVDGFKMERRDIETEYWRRKNVTS